MKPSCLIAIALSACAAGAHAQSPSTIYRVVVSAPAEPFPAEVSTPAPLAASPIARESGLDKVDVSGLFEQGMERTTKTLRMGETRVGVTSAVEAQPPGLQGLDRDPRHSRAWGLSLNFEQGPVTFHVAHQNRNVTRVAPATPLGNRMDARNTIIAANVNVGIAKVYAGYSANRGWGSSPLWNPDNPYGASIASSPSTDSRDILVGMAMPLGDVTFLASFISKNDRDLANHDVNQIAFGATYALSRRTDFYATYSHTALRNNAGISIAPSDSSAVNVGMRHSF
jgi:predicted porin